jgi:hypothetical protein
VIEQLNPLGVRLDLILGIDISIPLLTFLDLLGYYLILGGLSAVIFY